MITSRALQFDEPEQRPPIPEHRAAPPAPAVKYATIHRGKKRYNSGTGRYELTIEAIDAESGEVIVSETVRHHHLPPSAIITGESAVRTAIIEAGYTLTGGDL